MELTACSLKPRRAHFEIDNQGNGAKSGEPAFVTVSGFVLRDDQRRPCLTVHWNRAVQEWRVSHAPTGRRIARLDTKQQALWVATGLVGLVPWLDVTQDMDPAKLRAIGDLVSETVRLAKVQYPTPRRERRASCVR